MSGNQNISIKIRRQNRQSLLMQVEPGGVVVFIPRWLKPGSPQVRTFVAEGLDKLRHQIPPPRTQSISPDEVRTLVDDWARHMGLQPKRVTLRDMRRKWGSCSSRGNVTLNTALCSLPHDIVEYVVVHELAHLKVFNHSREFWALVEQYLPDYRVRKQTLDTYHT